MGVSNNTTAIGNTITSYLGQGIFIDGGTNITVDCQGKNMIGGNLSSTYGVFTSSPLRAPT